MALSFQQNEIGIKKIGVTANVPQNPFAKLMYYLGCVGSVLEISDEFGELIKYERYYALTLDEKKKLITLCYLFSPDVLIDKCWFESPNMDDSNDFLELTHVKNTLVCAESIMIGGRNRRVAKIMLFKRSWLQNNYLTPMRSACSQIQDQG